ncbi:hypothetical protein AVEN_68282-1 [Araneus ventricosus]|uniref:Uncharacterized protein n=1 Tax=Araneus ventricosus TaxID=182803 RepID=A0A4Y2HLE7_ARAVE|nr:hypothetical protein AVEN_68282-1 [Araneus ventricosus]
MSKSIWAIYFHKLSTDAKSQHGLCPMGSDSWCGLNKNLVYREKYIHTHSRPEPVLLATKKVFRELADQKLLSKCIHGKLKTPMRVSTIVHGKELQKPHLLLSIY